jgi:hypothetical protein
MMRRQWLGVKHARLYGEIRALADCWRARALVVDSTGVGAGLASFLEKALPGRLVPFVFSSASKSQLGWDFLAMIDSGRWKEAVSSQLTALSQRKEEEEFRRQLEYCKYEIMPGPGKLMRWGVPDGTRDLSTGELVHDDLIVSAALAAVLDDRAWGMAGPVLVAARLDPLQEIDRGF